MQSQLVQYGLNNNGIQFQSIQEQYPLGESVYCYFVVPGGVQQQVQQGDYIAVVPVGWRNVSELVGQKVINVENIWGTGEQRFGHVVFESCILPTVGHQQQYQFVFVRNGGLVQGVSRPFTFVPVGGVQQQFIGGQQWGQQQLVGGQQQWGQQQQQLVGQRLFGIQQWINRLRQVVYGQQGINGVEQYQYEPYHIQYQQGLRFLQRGLEQVLLNELEGVRCLQQGLQHIQQYVQLGQVLPQLFHQEIRRIQQAVQGLEQYFITYRPQQQQQQQQLTVLPQIGECSIYRQHVQTIQQGLQQLRTIVPVPFTVVAQEPTTVLRQRIQEIFSALPIESTWGQQQFGELIYTVGRFLIEQEKVEQVQRQLEQERIVSQLRTLGQVLLGQQQQGQRVVIGQRLNQLLREILQQVTYLRQREQLHMGSTGQRLAQLVQQFEGRQQIVDLQQLRQYVLDLVFGQVQAQVGLRGYYRDLAGLLDEIEIHFGEYLFSHLPQQIQQQIQQQQQIQTPVEYNRQWWSQQQTLGGLETELYTPVGTQSTVVYPTIQQLRNRFQELRSVRLGLQTGLTGLVGGECENVLGQVCGGVRRGLFEGQQQEFQQGEPIFLEQGVLRGQNRQVLSTVVPQIGSFQQQCNRLNF